MLYEMDRISPEELKDRKNAAKDDLDVSKMMKFVADEQGKSAFPVTAGIHIREKKYLRIWI